MMSTHAFRVTFWSCAAPVQLPQPPTPSVVHPGLGCPVYKTTFPGQARDAAFPQPLPERAGQCLEDSVPRGLCTHAPRSLGDIPPSGLSPQGCFWDSSKVPASPSSQLWKRKAGYFSSSFPHVFLKAKCKCPVKGASGERQAAQLYPWGASCMGGPESRCWPPPSPHQAASEPWGGEKDGQ